MRIQIFIIGIVILCTPMLHAQQNIESCGIPKEVGRYSNVDINTKDLCSQGDFLFVADGYFFKAIDVSDPTKPVDITEIDFGYPHSINRVFVHEGFAYLLISNNSGGEPGLHIIDITLSEKMNVVGYLPGYFLEIYVSDRYAYMCTMNEFQIWDVGDPENIFQIGTGLTLPEIQPYSLCKQGDYCYVTSSFIFGDNYLTIYDVSDVQNPFATAELSGAYGIAIGVDGDYCYSVSGSSFITYDVSDPEDPYEAALNSLPDDSRDICIQNNRAYVVGYETPFGGTPALWCMDISNPLEPKLEWEIIKSGAHEIWVEGNYAYLGCGTLGISIIDISHCLTPYALRRR